MAIDLELTHFSDQVEIPEDELQEILKIASWEVTPKFPYPGRTAWYVFKKPVYLKGNKEKRFYAVKLKGVGVWNPENAHLYSGVHQKQGTSSDAPLPPTTEEYKFTASIDHFGFTDDGSFQIVHSEPAPFGGLLHRRGVEEFENATRLLEKGVPSVAPLLVARLPESYKFKGEAMGISVTLSEEKDPYRLHFIHFGKGELSEQEHDYYTRLRSALGVPGETCDESSRLQVINALTACIGKLMHDFSAAGVYRYSGGWEDIQFCIKNKSLFLVDLDSSRFMEELSPCTRPLQALRDLSSSLHKLLNTFCYPTLLDKYSFSGLVDSDPVFEMLTAYFPASSKEKVKRVSRRFWSLLAPHFFLMKRHKDRLLSEWNYEERKSYKMDDEIFYSLSILNLYPLYCESDLNAIYPCECTMEDLHQRAQAFLGERYQYIKYLLEN